MNQLHCNCAGEKEKKKKHKHKDKDKKRHRSREADAEGGRSKRSKRGSDDVVDDDRNDDRKASKSHRSSSRRTPEPPAEADRCDPLRSTNISILSTAGRTSTHRSPSAPQQLLFCHFAHELAPQQLGFFCPPFTFGLT